MQLFCLAVYLPMWPQRKSEPHVGSVTHTHTRTHTHTLPRTHAALENFCCSLMKQRGLKRGIKICVGTQKIKPLRAHEYSALTHVHLYATLWLKRANGCTTLLQTHTRLICRLASGNKKRVEGGWGLKGGAVWSLSSYNLWGKDGLVSRNGLVIRCWRSHTHVHALKCLLAHGGLLSHVCAKL